MRPGVDAGGDEQADEPVTHPLLHASLYDLVDWAITGDGAFDEFKNTWAGLWDGVKTVFTTNPLTTLKGIWMGIWEPIRDSWKRGDYGEAIGRGIFDIIVAKALSKASKGAKGAKKPDVPKTAPKPNVPAPPGRNTPPARPSWRDSERAVGDDLVAQGYRPQVSFKDGKEVPYGTKGSSRPEYYRPGSSIEVKNYDVSTPAGKSHLVQNISDQAKLRQKNLPAGTKQTVVIDVRGQTFAAEDAAQLAERISRASGGAIRPEDVQFKVDTPAPVPAG